MKKIRIVAMILGLSLLFAVPHMKPIDYGNNACVASEASELMRYKKKAISQINEVDLSLYREKEALEITNLISETTERINECESIAEVNSVVSSFNRYLLTIKTDEELTIEEQENQEESDGVYYISSYEELLEFRDDVNDGYSYAGEKVVLTQDIIFPSGKSFGDPIGNVQAKAFAGTFDGNGHKIKGLKMSASTCALFYYGTGCTIKNLDFENVNITATSQRGASVISRADNITLDNVHVVSGTINSKVQGAGLVGAIVGESGISTITNCSNAATIATSGTTAAAGIVAIVLHGDCIIDNCTNTGTINAKTSYAGGILAQLYSGTINSVDYVGSVTIRDCLNSGEVTVAEQSAGGIVGGSISTGTLDVVGCKNNGNIHAGTADAVTGEGAAGIVGRAAKANGTVNIKYCWNDGDVNRANGTGYGTAGILGSNINNAILNISKCKNTGTISTTTGLYVGGIVGIGRIPNTNVVDNCYNSGNVEGASKANVGFISGCNRASISNCEVDANATAVSANGLNTTAGASKAPTETGNNVYNYIYGAQDSGGSTNVGSCRTITPKDVKFTVNYNTGFGKAVYLVGDFSNWVADNRYALSWTDGNNWTGTFTFAVGDTIEFKFVVAGDEYDPSMTGAGWENDPNRTLTIAANTGDQNLSWQV